MSADRMVASGPAVSDRQVGPVLSVNAEIATRLEEVGQVLTQRIEDMRNAEARTPDMQDRVIDYLSLNPEALLAAATRLVDRMRESTDDT